jgi:hypothetical protein
VPDFRRLPDIVPNIGCAPARAPFGNPVVIADVIPKCDGGADLTSIRRTSRSAKTQGEQSGTECHRHVGDIPGQMTVVS